MKRFTFLLFSGLLIASLWLTSEAQAIVEFENRVGNASFENSLGGASNWNNDAGRGIDNPIVADAPSGQRVLRLSESAVVAGQFSFTFQTVGGVRPGDIVTFGGFGREITVDGDDDGQFRIEFQNSVAGPGGFISEVIASINTATFARFQATGTAPVGTEKVTFTLRIQGADPADPIISSIVDFDDIVVTINNKPIQLVASNSGVVHSRGDASQVGMLLRNVSDSTISDVEVVATFSGGITIHSEQALLDGREVSQREGSVIFGIGDLSPGQESRFAFLAFLSGGVLPGKRYTITLTARTSGGNALSDTSRIVFEIEPDPLFHLGTIIGKVFDDRNANGMQDAGEPGIPNVRIATERGTVVHTDRYGKYHIPAVVPGRRLVKVDHHSLPKGTEFITEHSYLTKITEGLIAKVNFAVLLPQGDIPSEYRDVLDVHVVQEIDPIAPILTLELEPSLLKTGQGVLEREAKIKINTNYGPLIKDWRIEIRDEVGSEIWMGYGSNEPPSEIVWDGLTNYGDIIEPGDFAIRFVAIDKDGHEDWTPLQYFRVESKLEPAKNRPRDEPFAAVGFFNLFGEGKQSIPMSSMSVLRVQGKTAQGNSVSVNRAQVSVEEDGFFEKTIYVPTGTHSIEVTSTTPMGESLVYQKDVEIKENYLFMTALGEEQIGNNRFKGNIETVAADDRFRDGIYTDGRVAYYLKGRVQGKFLVTSSYDSEDDNMRKKLFTNLDPDDYYPVYGDASSIRYDGGESQDKFYVLLEKDKSFFKWGSFNTDFTDTELATHNRTMNGARLHFETVRTTHYGDPRQTLDVFYSEQEQRAGHNEFLGTGGSLYYVKNKRVVEGSEKLRVEVRDQLSGVVRGTQHLFNGQDYEIDYAQGRIILAEPLTSVASNDTLVNLEILDGNKNYLIVDYEYEDPGTSPYGSSGIRGTQHFGQNVRVGATFIEDRRPPSNRAYTMTGIDTKIRIGKNTEINAEYAESENISTEGVVSENGGLSFREVGTANLASSPGIAGRNSAYVIRVQSRPFERFDVSGYFQKYEPFFHNGSSAYSQGDAKKYGVESNLRITPRFNLRYRFDTTQARKKALVLNDLDRAKYHTFQARYDNDRLMAIAEYRHSLVEVPPTSNRIDSLFAAGDFDNAVAGKVGYRVTDKLMPYMRGQWTLNDNDNSGHQYGFGLEAKLNNKATLAVEENFGNIGDSTLIRFKTETEPGNSTYADIRMGKNQQQDRGVQTTIGSSNTTARGTRWFSEKTFAEYRGEKNVSNIIGTERTFFNNRLGFTFTMERNELDKAREDGTVFLGVPSLNNAYSGAVSFKDDFVQANSKLEYRRFSVNGGNNWQILSYSNVDVQLTEDIEFFTRFNFAKSRDLNLDQSVADFTEFNTGFALRPRNWDRLNVLTRYTFLQDNLPDDRFGNGFGFEQRQHILALEGIFDVNKYFQLVEKVAWKMTDLHTSEGANASVYNYLWINRVNYHVTRKWDVALEYRLLAQQGALDSYKHGVLVEVDRELYEYVRLGLGYNFTDFNDNLRGGNNYQNTTQGPFVRLTGKY